MNSLEEGETILLMLKSSRTEITVSGRLGPWGISQSPAACQATARCLCRRACGWASDGQAAALGRHLAVKMSP